MDNGKRRLHFTDLRSPTDWGELARVHDDWGMFQASAAELPVIDIHSRL